MSVMVRITETLCSTKLFFVIFSMQRQRWRSTLRRLGSWRATWAWIWWWQQPPRRWPTVPRNNQYLRTMAPVWIYISPFVGKWKWKLILNFTFVYHSCASHLFSSIIFIYSWYSILQRSPWVAPDLSQSHLEKQASSQPPFPIKTKKDLITKIKIFLFKKTTSSKWKHPWVLGKQSDSIRWRARQRELKRKWEIEKIVKKEAGHHLEIPSPQIA